MAGKESRGVQESEADLFRGRPYVLTGRDQNLESWIERIGARLVILDPEEHDRLVALTSHLPQLLSTALASVIRSEPNAPRVAGPAATEMTRLAQSPYEIWRDIFSTNAGSIDAALRLFIQKLTALRDIFRDPSMEKEFETAAETSRGLREVS